MADTDFVGSAIGSAFDGERIEMYFIRADGRCELLWQFDGLGDPSGRRRYLSVILSEDEARAVYERDAAREWILEPVHRQLEGREARVIQNALEGGDLLGGADVTITGSGSEDAFMDMLDATEVTTVGDYKNSLRVLRARLNDHERRIAKLLSSPVLWTRPLLIWETLKLRAELKRDRRNIEQALGERREIQDLGRGERRLAVLHAA